jgi:rfaE bifunctional protein nucleotidyltransferase chain/domain
MKKFKNLASVVKFIKQERKRGKKIVTTNGCFDVLHVGHIHSLETAKALGDVLVVGINSDASVRALKGKERPIVPAHERAEIIASLKAVDAVFVFDEKDPRGWLTKIKPNIHVKGSDRKMSEIIEREVVERFGGKIILLPIDKGKSTTNIIKKIKGK